MFLQSFTKKSYFKSGCLFLNLLSLGGFAITVSLSKHFYQVRNGTVGFQSFCNLAESFNCDRVAASSSAELVAGLPIASFAAGWYCLLLIASLLLYRRQWQREALRCCFLLSTLGFLISLPYFCIMKFQIGTYCLFCLILDSISLISALLAFALKPDFKNRSLNIRQWEFFMILLTVCTLCTVASLHFLFSKTRLRTQEVQELTETILNTPTIQMVPHDHEPSLGPLSAPIVIYEFSDFECPYCKTAALTLHTLMNRYPNQIRIVFKHFPLNQDCNPAASSTLHPHACQAAHLAICGHQQGLFQPLYEALFEHQNLVSQGKWQSLLEKANLYPKLNQDCWEAQSTKKILKNNIDEALQFGVQLTPTFFINGHKMEGFYPIDIWESIINLLLKENLSHVTDTLSD